MAGFHPRSYANDEMTVDGNLFNCLQCTLGGKARNTPHFANCKVSRLDGKEFVFLERKLPNISVDAPAMLLSVRCSNASSTPPITAAVCGSSPAAAAAAARPRPLAAFFTSPPPVVEEEETAPLVLMLVLLVVAPLRHAAPFALRILSRVWNQRLALRSRSLSALSSRSSVAVGVRPPRP